MNDGARLAFAGVAVSALAAMWSTEAIRGMLYQVHASDPLTFLVAGLTLVAVALFACYAPAHRASRVDPMTALRQD